ncbi:hypothetical protein H8356DRAFT_1416541 [Neocallimastix lanati (nom. inval.)]|nr:hypothetical protein H8356DRAFT_1416541 [Neocallimastix sp. JGI-2020a]
MKVSIVLTDATVLATIISGDCFSTRLDYSCCYSSTTEGNGVLKMKIGVIFQIFKVQVLVDLKCSMVIHVVKLPLMSSTLIMMGNWCDINVNVFYINPYFVEEVEGAIAQNMKTFSNAIWFDSIKNMESWELLFNKILLVVIVMPLLLANDVTILILLRKTLKAFKYQLVVLIVESYSIANMVTNLDFTPAQSLPFGESDGTSDETMKPVPETGQWFQKHFEQSIKNANSPL